MPAIDKRFLAKLLLTVVAIVGCLIGVHTIQAARIPDALARQAERAIAADKATVAIRYLRQYLEFRPNDADAQEKLADLLQKQSAGRSELVFLYDKILRADPSRLGVRRDALALCLKLNRNADAVVHAEALVKETPTDSTAWRQLGVARTALRQFDEARTAFETAVKHGPNDSVNYLELGEFLWFDAKKLDDAKAVFNQLIAQLPQQADGYLARARFTMKTIDTLPTLDADPVLQDLAKATEFAPTKADGWLLKGERLQRHREYFGARSAFAEGLKHQPGDTRIIRALAWLDVSRGNSAAAIAVLEDGVAHAKDSLPLLVTLGDLLVQSGDLTRADELVKKLEARKGALHQLQAKYLRGRVAMKQRRWTNAIATLTEVRTAAVEQPMLEIQANMLLALCYSEVGDTPKQIESLKLVTNKDANNVTARINLAQAFMTVGQFADASKEYEAAARHPNAPPGVVSTFVTLNALRLVYGESTAADWKQLEKTATSLATRFPSTADRALVMADLVMIGGNAGVAAKLLNEELPRSIGDVRVWAKLSEAVAEVGGVAAGLSVLDEAQTRLGDTVELRLARAELYARDPAQLRPLTNLELRIESWSEGDQTRLRYGLIDLYDRLGDSANVLRLYRTITMRRPADVSVWMAIAERALSTGDQATADEALATIAKLDAPESLQVAQLWKQFANGQTAVPSELPSRADANVVTAKMLEKRGEIDAAEKRFLRAVQLEPTQFGTMNALLAFQTQTKREIAMQATLKRMALDTRWSGEPMRRVIRQAARSVSAEAGLRLVKVSEPLVARQLGGLAWLADTFAMLGAKQDSLAVCEKLTRRTNATTDDWLRLAIRTGDFIGREASVKVVESAQTKLTPTAFAALAAAFAETPYGKGDTTSTTNPAEKRALTQAKLALLTTRLDRTAAVKLLDDYLQSPAADKTWAQRNLAVLLAVRGEPSDRKRAFELLADAGKTIDEKRATAGVLASLYRYLDGEERQAVLTRTIALLQEITPNSQNPRDAFGLVQALQAAGRPNDAIAVLQKLLNKEPENIDYLLTALNVLLDANQFDSAKAFAERVKAIAPTDIRVVTAVAKWECLRGHAVNAITLANTYERRGDATVAEPMVLLARTADLLDDLSRLPTIAKTAAGRQLTDVAVAKYDALLSSRPEVLRPLVAALAADGRASEAFAKIVQHAKAVPIGVRAAAGIAILRTAGGSPTEFEQVQEWLSKAIASEPSSLTLKLAEAEFYLVKNDLAKAEAAYEAVLARDPNNSIALNNLAWILAPQPHQNERAFALVDRAAKESGLTGELLDTRARIRIAAKQFALAEQDALEALKQDKTALRYFHLGLAQRATNRSDRDVSFHETFREALRRGLDAKSVHPLDLATLREIVRN